MLHVLQRRGRGGGPISGDADQRLARTAEVSGGDEALRGWIYRVALNTCISLNRSKRRRKTVPLTMDVNFFDPREERAQRVDQLHRRIARLQPFDRAIVLLWLEDLSYDEIGQILGITAKNVSVRLVRIREQMKKMKE